MTHPSDLIPAQTVPIKRAASLCPEAACISVFEEMNFPIRDRGYLLSEAVPLLQIACVALFDEASMILAPEGTDPRAPTAQIEDLVRKIRKGAGAVHDSLDQMTTIAHRYTARGMVRQSDAVAALLHRLSLALNVDHVVGHDALRSAIQSATEPRWDHRVSAMPVSAGFGAIVSLALAAERELLDRGSIADTRNASGRPSYPSEGAFIRLLAEIYTKAFKRPAHPGSVKVTQDASYRSPFRRFVDRVFHMMQLTVNQSGAVQLEPPTRAKIVHALLGDDRP